MPLRSIYVIALLIYCHLETFFYINTGELKGLLAVMFLIENKKKQEVQLQWTPAFKSQKSTVSV